jgi:predicted ATPase
MLKRLYVNNFRCMVNLEMHFDKINIILGPNGSGKSSLFDLLFNIRRLLVDNARVGDIFSEEDITAWAQNSNQSYELDVQSEDGMYTYKLTISHNRSIGKQRIELEQLLFQGMPLFEFKQGDVQLYHDNHTPGPLYTYDWNLSALATVAPRSDNTRLTWFKGWIEGLFVISLQPKAMSSETMAESEWLNRDGTNFASWYRYISQEVQDKVFSLTEKLRKTIPGFHAFKLEQAGKVRVLKVGFKAEENKSEPIYFDFDRLSDGQRVMIVLYSLIWGLQDLGLVLFLDEPENYVSLPEIQPWLMELNDACGERFPQTVLISHHPELIDYFASECGIWVDRDPLGPTRIKTMPKKLDGGIRISEQIARGWTE